MAPEVIQEEEALISESERYKTEMMPFLMEGINEEKCLKKTAKQKLKKPEEKKHY